MLSELGPSRILEGSSWAAHDGSIASGGVTAGAGLVASITFSTGVAGPSPSSTCTKGVDGGVKVQAEIITLC